MLLPLHDLILSAYQKAITIASLFNRKAKLLKDGRRSTFAKLQEHLLKDQRPVVWLHAASLGEFEQGRPVLRKLRAANPNHQFVVTFFSSSGYVAVEKQDAADLVLYLPHPDKRNALQFIDTLRPALVLWIKYEYWYHMLDAIHRRKIPLLLVSATFRKDQIFFRRSGALHRTMLGFFTHIFLQDAESKSLLNQYHLSSSASISGDTRFDRVAEIAKSPLDFPAIAEFTAGHPTLVAGSTWNEDEKVIDHYVNSNSHYRFVIAPHETHESHLRSIRNLLRHTAIYSEIEGRPPAKNVNTIIIDRIGMLSSLYRYGQVAYVGGGFGSDGIHNILEAAVYGIPVVFGPVYEKYREAVELVELGGAFSVDTALAFEEVVNRLFTDQPYYKAASEAAKRYVSENTGATEKIIRYIQENRLLTS